MGDPEALCSDGDRCVGSDFRMLIPTNKCHRKIADRVHTLFDIVRSLSRHSGRKGVNNDDFR